MKTVITVSSSPSADLSDTEIQQLKSGTWRIDCPKMSLRSRGNDSKRMTFGPGYIFQPSTGSLSFRLYSHRLRPPLRSDWLDKAKPGEIFPEDSYFDLFATDMAGRRWTSKRFLLSLYNQGAGGNTIIEGRLAALSSKSTLPRPPNVPSSSVVAWTSQRLGLPLNSLSHQRRGRGLMHLLQNGFSLDTWAIRFRSFKIFIRLLPDCLSLEVFSKSMPLPHNFERHLFQALEFVVGRPVHCQAICVRRCHTVETNIFSVPDNIESKRTSPPLDLNWFYSKKFPYAFRLPHTQLFKKFLTHSLSCREPTHPISGYLSALRDASAALYIDAYALTLSVVIEALVLNDVRLSIRRPSARHINSLIKLINSWVGPEDLKRRMPGMISSLSQIRASDVLLKLVIKSIITKEQYVAWKNLRNQSVHKIHSPRRNPRPLRELTPLVTVLFYRLVFYVIGYKGPYTDYSSVGWPVHIFPESFKGSLYNQTKPTAPSLDKAPI